VLRGVMAPLHVGVEAVRQAARMVGLG
jgi:hypothetical protein